MTILKLKNKKRNIILAVITLAVVAVLAVVVFGGWKAYQFRHPAGASEYSAVYLRTGEVYFGKLDWFPWPRIQNPWLLQKTQDGGVSVMPLASVFWSPVDVIYLNPKEVTFWTYLKDGSNIAKALKNPSSVPSVQQPVATQPAVIPSDLPIQE